MTHESPKTTGGSFWLRLKRLPVRRVLVLLVSLSFAIALFYVPWPEFIRALLSADPIWLTIAVLINMAAYPLWVTQWRLLAPRGNTISNRAMLEIVALSAMANSALPSAAGLASSVVLLATRGKMTTVAATSLMAMDQLLVGITKLVLLILALFLAPLPPAATQSAVAFAGLMAVFLALLVTMANSTRWMQTQATNFKGIISGAFDILTRVSQGLNVLRDPRRMIATTLLAFGKKAMQIIAAIAIQMACGIDVSAVSAILVIAAVSVTTALPIIPGGFGVYTATVFVVYEFFGVSSATALTAGILQHLVEILPNLLVGYGIFFVQRFSGAAKTE